MGRRGGGNQMGQWHGGRRRWLLCFFVAFLPPVASVSVVCVSALGVGIAGPWGHDECLCLCLSFLWCLGRVALGHVCVSRCLCIYRRTLSTSCLSPAISGIVAAFGLACLETVGMWRESGGGDIALVLAVSFVVCVCIAAFGYGRSLSCVCFEIPPWAAGALHFSAAVCMTDDRFALRRTPSKNPSFVCIRDVMTMNSSGDNDEPLPAGLPHRAGQGRAGQSTGPGRSQPLRVGGSNPRGDDDLLW